MFKYQHSWSAFIPLKENLLQGIRGVVKTADSGVRLLEVNLWLHRPDCESEIDISSPKIAGECASAKPKPPTARPPYIQG